jgi:amino acid adenylation domain-containing protein
MVLAAGFSALLHRLSGQSDVLLGFPIANRNRAEIEGLIGFFVNTLVLRTGFAGELRFGDHLLCVKESTLGAYAHQDLPFEKLVEELRPERDLSINPVFQVMLVLQNAGRERLELAGLSMEPLPTPGGTAQFDLSLSLLEGEAGIDGAFEYDAELFDAATMQRWMAHFGALLRAVVQDAEVQVARLPLLGELEIHQLCREWDDTAATFADTACADPGCLVRLVERQVDLTPEAVAVVGEETTLTYRELDRWANRVAHHLLRAGAARETAVAICVERGPEMIAGLLGVLKTGAHYVPLDPEYPRERLGFMIEDAEAPLLLTQEKLLDRLPACGARIFLLDRESPEIAAEKAARPVLPVVPSPDNLAYVIYTSGSTGRPKGVMVPHRGVLNRLLWAARAYPVTAADRILVKASFSFDFSVWECFAPLLAGARLVLAAPGGQRDPEYLARRIVEQGVTLVHFVPSMLQSFLAAAGSERCTSLRFVFAGGETLPLEAIEQFQRRLGTRGPVLRNQYGPTEITIDLTEWVCRPERPPRRSVPIGRPLANTAVHVLDASFQPVPIGIVGELCLGGVGVARGYLRRPELTAARFIPDPVGESPGARLYRSGDLGCRLPDGEIEFLGRLDHQVKVRGFRIEPGEIETALTRHPGVREAVVVALPEPASGQVRLVAYVVPDAEPKAAEIPDLHAHATEPRTPLSLAELRTFLRGHLPEHMLPASFVLLAALPLSPAGKLDRRALPPPEATGLPGMAAEPRDGVGDAPATPSEELLAAIWAEVLCRDRIGRDEDFFVLGGHSLLATQVVSRVREAFAIELPLRDLFTTPTVRALAAQLDAGRRELAAVRPGKVPPLVSRPRLAGEDLPLSFAQQRLWFLDQLEAARAAYHTVAVVRLSGVLSPPALAAALAAVVARHEALRTTFPARGGQPVQRIAQNLDVPLPRVDLSALPVFRREPEASAMAGVAARRRFDLPTGPLLRGLLLRLDEHQHVALLAMHHIVADGWSMGVLLRELAAFYALAMSPGPSSGGAAVHTAPPPPLPVQYADFAGWQRQWLAGEVLQAELDFWRRQLAGAPPVLEIQTDRPRPATQTYRGRSLPVTLPPALTLALAGLARRSGATLFMTLLTAFQALLSRTSGQRDLVVGSPIAGRNYREIENLIGCFVNTLALRADLTIDLSFATLLAQMRQRTLDAYAHQDLPFEILVEALQPRRDFTRNPLFQVAFALQNAPLPELALPGLRLAPLAVETETSKFDLMLTLEQRTAGTGGAASALTGSLELNTDLFDTATIARLAAHLEHLLAAVVEEPERLLSELPLLGPAERHQLTQEWNDTRSAYPDRCVHELFSAQARRTPVAVALRWRHEEWTYSELDEQAERWADQLRALGVGPDCPVGVLMERSLEMVVALLAILKAGGAYLPLDPAYPSERLTFMLADAGASVLLAHAATRSRLSSLASATVALAADGARGDLELPFGLTPPSADATDGADVAGAARRARAPLPDNLAYIIYTSGSTGRPKGVAMPHRGVVRLVLAGGYAKAGPHKVFLQLASISFDASTFEIWTPLLTGGSLAIYPEARVSLEELGDVIASYGVTTLWLTAGLFHQMAERYPQRLRPVHQLLVGGDAVSVPHARRVLEKLPGLTLIDGYGPTENCCFSSCHRLQSPDEVGATVAIGRPIGATTLYLLDTALQRVPVNVTGELYTGGDGLARGYWRRPELTAERFVPDPFAGFGSEPGARLYRTGDLARYRPDGAVDFLGRLDQQVKVRGYRIELGEIEAALTSHPAVRESAVMAIEGEPGEGKCLIAYVVMVPVTSGAIADLRRWLRERLPEHMVPSAFLLLESLPLTANGKVDRRALPALHDTVAGATPVATSAPRGPIEELLAGIFEEVLRRERVGRDEDFFDLGGHSLLATQVVSRIRDALGVELRLHEFFAASTLAGLAAAVEMTRRGAGGGRPLPPPIEPLARTAGQSLPLSFAQRRLWLLDRLAGTAAYNISIAMRLCGELRPLALGRALCGVVARHEMLRTRFVALSGEPSQVVAAAATPPWPMVDLALLPPPRREPAAHELAAAVARQRFDLAGGPPLRALLLRLAAHEHIAVVTLHHIGADGWSLGILLRELAALYTAELEIASRSVGESAAAAISPLAPLPVQYADFAAWQRRWMAGETLETELAYWRRQLDGAPPVLELPTDRPRPAMQSLRGATRRLALPPRLTQALAALARRSGATLFMTLLAAFQALLSRLSGQRDLVVGSPIAGRNYQEIEGLIGCFVNVLALRADLTADPSFSALLAQMRQTALDAYAHQDLPFELLVEALQPHRDLARNPLFQIAFALQNAPLPEIALPGLGIEPIAEPSETAKFELSLLLQEATAGPPSLVGVLEYATDLFDAATAERLARRFAALLASAIEAPLQRISTLSWLASAERHQLLVEWNDRSSPTLAGGVHQLVAEQSRARPDALALISADLALTYGELESRANRLAHHLRAVGVGPEVIVGVCIRRSVLEVVALLAVLKAGGAYLPLDPAYPPKRQRFALEDADARVLLRGATVDLEPPTGVRLVNLETGSADWEAIARCRDDEPASRVFPSNLAYIIYTSGTTGRPKGVQIEHRQLLQLVAWHRRAFAIGSRSRTTRLAGPAFDAAVWEIWTGLAAGTSIYIPDDETLASAPALRDWLLARAITHAFAPTPLAEELLALGWPGVAPLRELLTGGDRLHLPPKDGLPFLLVNNYGPTETTVVATSGLVAGAAQAGPAGPGKVAVAAGAARPPSIGRPIDGVHVYLLDEALEPVPVGVPGEIHIAGHGVGRGYRGRAPLTAERFIPDPFAGDAGARMYRTGDLAHYLGDGHLGFLGRRDQQVKVRGVRIELGEIEATLAAHSSLGECAVVARDDRRGDHRLVAYVVAAPDGSPPPTGGELAALARQRLPDTMVPSTFVLLDRLPKTANGKVDREALPEPEWSPPRLRVLAPRDSLELELVRIWEDLLGVFPIGVRDDFFTVGGHSLQAVRLLGRIRASFGRDLPLSALFQGGTVEGLATLLRQGAAPAHRAPLVPIQETGARPPLFCIHPIGGNVFCYLELARQLDPDQPLYGLQSPDPLPGGGRLATVEAMAAHYLEALRRHTPAGPYQLAGWSFGGVVAFEMARQLAAGGEEPAPLLLLDSRAPVGEVRDDGTVPPFDHELLAAFANDLLGLGASVPPSAAVAFSSDLQALADNRLELPGQSSVASPVASEAGLRRLYERARETDLLPPDLELGQLAELFATFANHCRALASYRPRPYRGALVLLRAGEGPPHTGDPLLGWGALAGRCISVHEVSGDHYSMLRAPQVADLAQRIADELAPNASAGPGRSGQDMAASDRNALQNDAERSRE